MLNEKVRTVAGMPRIVILSLIAQTLEFLKRILTVWHDRAAVARKRRALVKKAAIERDNRLLGDAFFLWSGNMRERGLHKIENQVSLRHEDTIIFDVWDRWKHRTSRLPAISFEKVRLKKVGWLKWRQAIQYRRSVKAAVAPLQRRLVADVFSIWKEIYHQKAARRASRLRGRLRLVSQASNPPRQSSGPTYPSPLDVTIPPNSSHQIRSRPNSLQLGAGQITAPTSQSVIGDTPYSRLRTELNRRKGVSEEPIDTRILAQGSSDLLRALRGTLPGR